MIDNEIEKLIRQIAKLPSLGNRSAKRIVLQLIKKKDDLLLPLIEKLQNVAENIRPCKICGNFGTSDVCSICADEKRDSSIICVVQDVADLWAMERVSFFQGKYHVLEGVLSALDGIAPEDLNVEKLVNRIKNENIKEVILALPATIDGQITTQYLLSTLKNYFSELKVTTLAQGIPMGAELDYMDEGTLQLAFNSRKNLE